MKIGASIESVRVALEANDNLEVRCLEVSEKENFPYLEAGRDNQGGVRLHVKLTDAQLFRLKQGIEIYFFHKGEKAAHKKSS